LKTESFSAAVQHIMFNSSMSPSGVQAAEVVQFNRGEDAVKSVPARTSCTCQMECFCTCAVVSLHFLYFLNLLLRVTAADKLLGVTPMSKFG
jgi:hypothetical protein